MRRGSSPTKNFLNVNLSFLKFSSDNRVPNVPVTKSTVYEREDKPSLLRIFFSRFFSSQEKKQILEEAEDLPPEVTKEVQETEEEIEYVDEEVDELENERESLLTRLFSLFRRAKTEEVDEEEIEEVELDENELLQKETREALRMIHKWIGRLPPDQINAFKRSPDFQKYKDILNKYNLIK